MKILNIIKIAIKNLVNNKLRSSLTMLGLIIGIASVIVLVGIGNGASNQVNDQVSSLGTDMLMVNITSEESLDSGDVKEMQELSNIDAIAPYKSIVKTVSRKTTTNSKTSILATTSDYLTIQNLKINSGRNLSPIDIENKTKVAIIGYEVAINLFNLSDPLGESIKIDGDNYIIIGVLEEQGTTNGVNIDNMVLIPLSTAKYLGSDSTINSLYIKVTNEEYISETTSLVENYLRSTLQISSDYYTVSSQDSMLDAMENINNTLSLLLGGIASISLIVGGIGVMNVMLVSVSERTKEIGIRKSLGAKKKDILFQFLIEALILSLLGGMLGILLGLIIGNVAETLGYDFVNSYGIVMLSFITSLLIGLIFGIFPSYRASCLNPIDALRTE